MRPFSFGHRWLQRHPLYSRPSTHNPWINSSGSSLQPGLAIDSAPTRIGKDAADKVQQTEAIATWEDEGGSVAPRRSLQL